MSKKKEKHTEQAEISSGNAGHHYCYLGPSIPYSCGGKVTWIRGSVFRGASAEELTEGMEPDVAAAVRDLLVPVSEAAVCRGEMQRGSAVWVGRIRKLETALLKAKGKRR